MGGNKLILFSRLQAKRVLLLLPTISSWIVFHVRSSTSFCCSCISAVQSLGSWLAQLSASSWVERRRDSDRTWERQKKNISFETVPERNDRRPKTKERVSFVQRERKQFGKNWLTPFLRVKKNEMKTGTGKGKKKTLACKIGSFINRVLVPCILNLKQENKHIHKRSFE